MQLCALEDLLVARIPHNHIHNVGLDRLALVCRQNLPPVFDAVLESGEGKKFALLTLGPLEDCIDACPCLCMLLELRHERVDLFPLVLVAARVHGVDHLSGGSDRGRSWRKGGEGRGRRGTGGFAHRTKSAMANSDGRTRAHECPGWRPIRQTMERIRRQQSFCLASQAGGRLAAHATMRAYPPCTSDDGGGGCVCTWSRSATSISPVKSSSWSKGVAISAKCHHLPLPCREKGRGEPGL